MPINLKWQIGGFGAGSQIGVHSGVVLASLGSVQLVTLPNELDTNKESLQSGVELLRWNFYKM